MGIVTKALIGNLSIRPNDILISRGNGSKSLVGLAGLVGTVLADTEPVLFPDTMIRARLKGELCDPRFFALIWNSRFVRDQIERTARTTAGIHKISQADIERFQIPLPPIVEQAVIVGAAETALSNVQHTEEALTRLLARSASLRAAVLTDAFSGRLIPQDPSDEPASALLERIRAERTGTPNPPVRRGHEKNVHA
jgi:type I restriction enzyme S subunit